MRKNNSSNHIKKDIDDDSELSIKLSLLTYKQRALIESIRRDYLPQVLKDQGLLEEDKGDKSDSLINDVERLVHEMEFVLAHHQRTQKIELNLMKLREIYANEIDPYRRTIIYEHFVAVQYYLTAYYFALTDKLKEMNNKNPISS